MILSVKRSKIEEHDKQIEDVTMAVRELLVNLCESMLIFSLILIP